MERRKKNKASLVNRTTIRVRFSEVDSMHIVWHGEYVRYFEDGREAFGREFSGLNYMEIYNSGFVAPLVKLSLDFKLPLRCGETAIVETSYINCEAAKILFEYTIFRERDMQVVATGESIQVFLNSDGVLELVNPKFYLDWKKRWNVK
ncbi:MAG: acyl-CoA thioesterase [Bacteroidales bacterium]